MCGRLATPAASHCAWMRAMLRSTLSMSMTAQGVPYSRAIFAARGVVIRILSHFVGWVERSETHQSLAQGLMGFAALYPSYKLTLVLSPHVRLPVPAIDPPRRQALSARWRWRR